MQNTCGEHAEPNQMRTSNIERPTSNIEVKKEIDPPLFTSMLDVQCSVFDVRIDLPSFCILHSAF